LYAVFSFLLAADDDRSTITLTTLLLRAGIPYTAFAHEVFTIFSAGRLDFRALALTIWNYCTLTIENMRKILNAALYTSFIDRPSFHFLVQTCSCSICITHIADLLHPQRFPTYSETCTEKCNGERTDIRTSKRLKIKTHIFAFDVSFTMLFFSSHCSATVELRQLEVLEAKFTLESFNTFMFTRMVLLVPAMQLQRSLQKVFCGRSFWREQTQNRKNLYPEHNYVSIAHLLNPVCLM